MKKSKEMKIADPLRYPGTPRWIKISGLIVGIIVLSGVILAFLGSGSHGPARHLSSSTGGGETLAYRSSFTA